MTTVPTASEARIAAENAGFTGEALEERVRMGAAERHAARVAFVRSIFTDDRTGRACCWAACAADAVGAGGRDLWTRRQRGHDHPPSDHHVPRSASRRVGAGDPASRDPVVDAERGRRAWVGTLRGMDRPRVCREPVVGAH